MGEIADIEGLAVMLIDTPGQREAADTIEQAAIAASQGPIDASDLIVVVFDATVPPTHAIEYAGALVVVNKTDQPFGWDFSSQNAICISARTGGGIEEFSRRIHERLGVGRLDESRACWWTHRQRAILMEALNDPAAIEKIGIGGDAAGNQ